MQGLRTDAGAQIDVGHGGFDPEYYLRERYATQGIARFAGAYYLRQEAPAALGPDRAAPPARAHPRPAGVPALADRGPARAPPAGHVPAGDRGGGRRARPVRELLARRAPLRVRADARRRGPRRHREHRARARGRARARHRLVVELRRRGLPDPGRRLREAPRRRLRDRPARHPARRQAVREQRADLRARRCRRSIATSPTGRRSASARRSTYRNADWMPRAGQRSTTARSRTPTRSSRRRAAAARSSRSSSTTSSSCRSRSCRTTRCGSSCSEPGIDLWVEKSEWITREPRAREPRHPPRLPDQAGPARPLRRVPRPAERPRRRLARPAARRRELVEGPRDDGVDPTASP